MKSLFTSVIVLFATIQLSAQASAVVFSEVGEKFTIYLNGEKKNATPQSNVKISGLTSDFYQARIDFEDALLKDFAEGNFAVQQGAEVTYIVKKNKKGEYVLRYYGQTDGSVSMETGASQTQVKSYAEVDNDPHSGAQQQSMEAQPMEKTTVTQTTTTTTKTQPASTGATGGNVSMGINVDGVSMGININATELGGAMQMDIQETQHTTVTTTTTTTTNQTQPAPRPAPAPAAQPAKPVGRCASSMAPASFSKAKDTISSNSFEESKLTVAKQVTKANCPTAAQIAEIMGLFSFEETKIDYAKFAYDFCYNQGDYYEVNTAFTFEASIEELNSYLESK
jgi:Domain of unknown function (DUF4476)